MEKGEIYWVDFGLPIGSEPAFRRPAVIVQSNTFNQTKIRTVICAIMTSNLTLADAPGNVFVEKEVSKLQMDSVVNISQLYTVDKTALSDFVSRLPMNYMPILDDGMRLVLGLG